VPVITVREIQTNQPVTALAVSYSHLPRDMSACNAVVASARRLVTADTCNYDRPACGSCQRSTFYRTNTKIRKYKENYFVL